MKMTYTAVRQQTTALLEGNGNIFCLLQINFPGSCYVSDRNTQNHENEILTRRTRRRTGFLGDRDVALRELRALQNRMFGWLN